MTTPKTQNLSVVAAPPGTLEKAAVIDEIASSAMAIFEGAQSFQAELQVAQSIKALREALTQEVMAPVMALMNTDLGFLTDKDPKRAKQGVTVKEYTVEIVRDCLIEAKLRGFHTVGNEFNIISGRFYAAKNGLKRRCETWPGVTALKVWVDVPKMRDGGAICKVQATWKKQGLDDRIDGEIAVKVNEYMGADAIVGKAERKLYKRVFDRLSGRVISDGEIDDPELNAAKPANVTSSAPPAPPPPQPATTAAAQAQTQAPPPPEAKNPPPPPPAAAAPASTAPAVSPSASMPPGNDGGDIQTKLGDFMVGHGISWEVFSNYGVQQNWQQAWDQVDGFNMLTKDFAEMIWRARNAIGSQIQRWKAEKGL